ncbi:calcium-binding and coiled-coil domain-containing protein 1 isoform X1 [Notechis scutatus]|uniref:Calcium-binding and coiled-coil domain-containing protein 1 isoform X1 n=1 Tax=Notechis scutatus TaxID=8663 RepID=A0A6J1UQ25_9SAUR|nr:calcium-binding and coiled-coil domain-containing protein 1 isoform X1 [Notechis scutatus]XP_026533062.1 calcium-binding and coiled-coil domain-containing protein 1 isoform X1 [Notechis scutatus]
MEEAQSHPSVAFLNVASSYVPHTKVECYYNLPPGMKPSTRDWIGIFKVDASSVRDYYTFVWGIMPDGGASEGTLHCSVQFQASYLPKPGPQQYHFRYVDRHGEVHGQSSPFQFSEPRPMDELVTLEEASDDGGGTDMLLVVPKAALLETQLEESRQEQGALLRESCHLKEEVQEWRSRAADLEAALSALRDEHTKLAAQYKELSNSYTDISKQRDTLSLQDTEQVARIQELEGDIQAMGEKMLQRETELDRVKDTVKSLVREQEHIHHQLKEENAEKEQYQVKLQASKEESRSLASDLQEAKTRHGEKISQALMLQEDIQKLQQKLAAANRRTVQMESLCEQLRTTQDVLAASQQKVALLGEELASVASIRDRTISDLHKSRLEAAEVNIKLADMTLKWKEGKGQWWKEKAMLLQNVEAEKDKILKLSAEVLRLENCLQEERAQCQVLRMDLAQERDASLVQVSENRRELRELRAALQVGQKEKEQLQSEKQELLVYIRRLEERLEKVADDKWSESVLIDEEERALDTPAMEKVQESANTEGETEGTWGGPSRALAESLSLPFEEMMEAFRNAEERQDLGARPRRSNSWGSCQTVLNRLPGEKSFSSPLHTAKEADWRDEAQIESEPFQGDNPQVYSGSQSLAELPQQFQQLKVESFVSKPQPIWPSWSLAQPIFSFPSVMREEEITQMPSGEAQRGSPR